MNMDEKKNWEDFSGDDRNIHWREIENGEPEGRPEEKPAGARAKSRLRRRFTVGIGSVLAAAVIGLAGLGTASLVRGFPSRSVISAAGSSSGSASATLQLSNTAAVSATSAASGSQNAQQVYSTVKDSIVTIETYASQSVEPSAEGSGIIMSADGYIITNEHVIDGASSIQVVLSDNKKYTAKLVGSDVRTDLAVLKISASGLKAAAFGNSDQIGVAETVLAIGNPGGIEFSGSVTSGIVSAVNRTITTESGYSENCIQTDAAINPGNSGGALVNMQGQVIGITSSKISADGYEGMGFAIPINTAQPVVNDIIQYGYVTGRVKLGISVTEYDTQRASALGYPAGLLVQSVESGSDAASQGVAQGDIITKINGTSVTTTDQLYQEESKYKSGSTVKLTIYRYSTGKTSEVSVKLEEDKGGASAAGGSASASGSRSYSQS